MSAIPDLIRLLDDPEDDEALGRIFGEPKSLEIHEDLLAHPDDRPFLFKELVCNLLADHGPDAAEAVPAVLCCVQDETESTCAKFMRLASATAIWEITGDPVLSVEICERLLLDSECWFRRYVVELLEEIGHPAALPALRGRIVDDRFEVRDAAKEALEKIEGGLS